MIQNSYCPHCGKRYYSGQPYVAIQSPFIDCTHCKQEFIDTNCMEWDLKLKHEQTAYWSSVVLSSLMYGLFLSIVTITLAHYLEIFGFSMNDDFSFIKFLWLVPPFSVLLFAYSFFMTKKLISLSRERMRSDNYRHKLRRHGILSRVEKFKMRQTREEARKQKNEELWK